MAATKIVPLILTIILMASAACADEAVVTSRAYKETVGVGERFAYSITVKNAKDVEFPIVSADNLTLVSSELTTVGILNKEYTMQYIMRGFMPGTYAIGGYKVRYKTDSTQKEAAVPSVSVIIQSALFDNDTLIIAPIKGPVEGDGGGSLYWWWLLGAAILIAAAALVYYYMKRRKPKQPPPPPPRLAHEVAYEALQRLMEKNLDKAGLIKEYFTELSSIVRYYIEDRFWLKAPEMTTEEFLHMVRESLELSNVHKELLRDFLNRSDMVKFAKYGPSSAEIEGSFAAAWKFVDETREIPQDD
ncbi:MAG: BatD family protein [Candidatus Magnetominusculus sp. LBB02]|nr:BatD family protein [Candidatus Magnetominusculus sp. LBB02]